MAHKLAVQCLRIIFGYLIIPATKFEGRSVNFHWYASKTDISTCALVCRIWHPAANEILYREIEMKSVYGHCLDNLLATIEQSPYHAGLIRVLHADETAIPNAGDSIARILRAACNLRWYTLNTRPGHSSLSTSILPTSQNSRLKTLALVGLSRGLTTCLESSDFRDLPNSIEDLALDAVDLCSVKLDLPNLRHLRYLMGGWCHPTSFGDCIVTSLYLYEPTSTNFNNLLTCLGRGLKCLRIESWLKCQMVDTGDLASLECIDLVGPCTQMNPSNFPPNLEKISWKCMTWARVSGMLKVLSDPRYLLNLKSMPALYWYLPGGNHMDEEEDSLAAYDHLCQHAFQAMRSRGLPCLTPTADEANPERAYPVFTASLSLNSQAT